jgi:hypothetical protein
MTSATRGIDAFRSLRRQLEDSVLPLATSLDGRRFALQAPVRELPVRLGGYVGLGAGDDARLGQVTSLRIEDVDGPEVDLPLADGGGLARTGVSFRLARGEGVVLAGAGPFVDAALAPAEPADVAAWLRGVAPRGGRLATGELPLAGGVPFALDASGFGRHTFLCGQSGSGKTYATGLLLEQLLLETDLRIVVLDPNSDYARMGALRPDADPEAAVRYGALAARIDVRSGDGLRLRLGELEPAAQAALLRLDPVGDREEYAELAAIVDAERPVDLDALAASPAPGARALHLRAENLGIGDLGVWARDRGGSVIAALAGGEGRMLVVDLGSLSSREEQAIVAAGVLAELWRRRAERRPTLVVLDEAHNVCPGVAEDPLVARATRDAIAIAAEGRKFGLHLLVCTQRPQKIHENVLTQCENLVLMRLNAAADVAFAQDAFSFVPRELLGLAASFRQGEALVAGRIASHAAIIRFGARVAQEGGADVPATWARGAPR